MGVGLIMRVRSLGLALTLVEAAVNSIGGSSSPSTIFKPRRQSHTPDQEEEGIPDTVLAEEREQAPYQGT